MARLLPLIVSALVLILSAACGDDDASPSATSEPSAPAAREVGGDDGFRSFASVIDDAVKRGDTAFFRDRMVTERVDCSTAAGAGGIGGPACETPDAVYDGFGVGFWRSEGGTIRADDAAQRFNIQGQLTNEVDSFGSGVVRVYALNVRDGAYKAVITWLQERPADFAGTGPLRGVLSTNWAYRDNRWQLEAPLITAYVLAEDFLGPHAETGYDAWERFEP